MKGLMIQGTSSDVGKSLIVTALCRLFANEGVDVTPFKSQNMSNNSYVTTGGKEIGRAQGIQAEAAKTEAVVWMSPILLKPQSNLQSEIVLLGETIEIASGKAYRETFYETGLEVIQKSLKYLEENFDVIVIEGAGSPAEINLKDRELVNMKVAEMADVPVILVADIDRGGVFASIVGTLELLSKEERNRVKGLMINKFRGDKALLQDGLDWLENKTGIPVLGVIPFMENHHIDGEDSLQVKQQNNVNEEKAIDIVVLELPLIANYSDIEPFFTEEDVQIRLVKEAADFGHPDAIIIPDTNNIVQALQTLKNTSLLEKVISFTEDGGFIVGIAAGFRIMGKEIKQHAETIKGLHLIDVTLIDDGNKETTRVKGTLHPKINYDGLIEGFQMTPCRTEQESDATFFLTLVDGKKEGFCHPDGKIIGTNVHHLFHNAGWRNEWLNRIRVKKKLPVIKTSNANEIKEKRYDLLAAHLEKHLDFEETKEIMRSWNRGD